MAWSLPVDTSVGGGAGSGVSSFNSRTGDIVPQTADYDASFLTPAEGDAAYDAIGLAAAAAAASQPLDADLTAIAALVGTGAWAKRTGAGTWALTTPTAAEVGAPSTSRSISTTAPLTGGGDLSSDRTLSVSTFVASGGSHATGVVPDPGATAGTAALLREDASWVDFVLESNVTPSTAQLGTTETKVNFDTTVPYVGGTLQVGDVIEIRAQGIQTVQLSTDSVVYTIEWGGTTLCTTGNMDPSGTANNVISVTFNGTVAAIGASGSIVGYGIIEVFSRGGSTVVAHRVATGSGSTSGTTIDTTADATIAISEDRNTPSDDTDSQRLDWITFKVRRRMPG